MENVGIEYGGGLFSLAKEESLLDEIYSETKEVSSLIVDNPEYSRLMNSHRISKEEKEKLLEEAFKGKVHPYIYNFLCIMEERGYFSYVIDSFSYFETLWMKEKGIIKATVESAVVLTKEQLDGIKVSIEERTKKKVLLTSRVEPSLIAGLRVFADGELFENSAKSRFEEIDKLLQSSVTTY